MAGRRLKVIKICEECGQEFHPWQKEQRFCCKKCSGRYPLITLTCEQCGKEFSRSRSAVKRRKHIYCSRKCYLDSRRVITECAACGKKVIRTIGTVSPTSYCSKECADIGLRVEKIIIPCDFCGKEVKRYPSDIEKARRRGYRFTFCSHSCRAAMIAAQYKVPDGYTGSRAPVPKERNCQEYKEWRKAVWERDNYICQDCNATGIMVCAHHLKPFALFPELRYEVSNGITLCFSCHESRHSLSHSHQPP